MPQPIFDTIKLDVIIGPGFKSAQPMTDDLAASVTRLGQAIRALPPLTIDTAGIARAAAQIKSLQAGMGRGFVPPGIAGAKAARTDRARFAAVDKYYADLRRAEEGVGPPGGQRPRPAPRRPRHVFPTAHPRAPSAEPPLKSADTLAATENLNKMNAAMEKTVASATDMGKAMPKIPPAVSGVTNSLRAAVPAAEAARVKLDALKLTGGNMKPALAEAATAQTNLKNAIVGATGKLPANSKALKAANSQLRNLNKTMTEAKGQTNAYALSWKNMTAVMGKVAFWMVATGAIYGSIRAFKSALDIIIKVDHAMADIRKVYQGAPGDIKPLRDDLIKLNIALGGNVEGSIEAAVGWARLGYERREIIALMRTSMLAMNIAELNATEATELLTAAMQQFKIPATGAITVLDSWNELSNRTLATTRDLGDSVSIAGATFHQTGDSVHYLNAITATLVQTMAKSGREVGTAMRTLGTFMYRPKTIKKVKAITGVEIEKAPSPDRLPGEEQMEYTARLRDNMKSQSEVLGEVAAKWETLTEKQQINLAQSMAGVRRYNYFISLMGNYDMVMDNLLMSINSVGSAERENAIYMDTLQKQIERLKNSFTKLYISAGDGGLAGALKGTIKLLTFLVSGFASVNFTVPLITVTVLLLVNAFKKLISTAGGFGNILKSFRSPMAQLNVGLLAIGAAFMVLESAAASAQRRIASIKEETDKWIGSMGAAVEGIKTVAENAEAMSGVKKFIEMKYKPGTPEHEAAMKRYNDVLDRQAELLMLNAGMTYEEARAKVEAGNVTQDYTDALDRELNTLDETYDKYSEIKEILERFEPAGKATEDSLRAAALAAELVDHEDVNVWRDFGDAVSAVKEKKFDVFKERDVFAARDVANALDTVNGKLKSLSEARAGAAQEQLNLLVGEMGDVSESAGGAGKKIDRLQQLMDLLSERLRGINRDTALVNHLMEFNNNILDEMEGKYRAATYATDGYLTTLGEQSNYIEDSIALKEATIIKDRENIEMLRASREGFIKSGTAVKDYNDQMDGLVDTLHQDEEALQDLENQLIRTRDRGFGAFMDLIAKQRGFEHAPDVLSRVLPSRRDTANLARDIGYIMDELKDIGETTGKDIIGAMSRWGIHANSIYMDYDRINMMLMDINVTEKEREAIENRLKDLQDINIAAAQKLNQEYDHLANTFQSIVDDGLWGMITGEQTALDLAKQIGIEYGKIALKTLTQPFTERLGAGMGATAYFMKHGKMPQMGMTTGLANARVTADGAVLVKDVDSEAQLNAINAIGAGGAQGAPGGLPGVGGLGPQGARQPQPGGGGMPGWLMPAISGGVSGAMMGAGGGAGGAMFGAAMGTTGGVLMAIPTLPTIIAGAAVSMLSLLGNLFGGRQGAQEEDPYQKQQATRAGERHVQIGSAGIVHNEFHVTVYYESSTDSADASRLLDRLEDEAATRAMSVQGSVRQAV